MMYYRRKLILALLEKFGEKMDNIRFQKLLFLATRKQEKPSFDFIPYKFGPFSFLSYQDKRTMAIYELIEENDKWEKKDKKNYFQELTEPDRKIINEIYLKFSKIKDIDLIKYVYSKYPEYAINSELTDKYRVSEKAENKYAEFVFFTIGYEGRSIDEYIHLLIKNKIKLVCDVRKNPLSMKYGFSKNQLKNLLEKVDIKYHHIPKLGIESEKREDLKTKEDYEKLFKDYYKNSIPSNEESIRELLDLFSNNKQIAITCFESDYQFCHRSKISEYLQNQKDWDYKIVHI